MYKILIYVDVVREFLRGRKAYLIALSVFLTALIAWASGEITTFQFIQGLFASSGLASLRAGISNR